jgi:AAHS family 4-hydroxybenzoate transporter-like MFS transporter
MPNATTLLSEYTPERKKSLLVTSMFCGFNLGMAGGGFISPS